jgi:hypothetical protein
MEPAAKKQCSPAARGRNSAALAEKHPLDFDARVTFHEDKLKDIHEYRVEGNKVAHSASDIVKMAFPDAEFKPRVVAQRCLASWRKSGGNAKYAAVIAGKTDAEAIDAVCQLWTDNADSGTKMHKLFELLLNDVVVPMDDEEFLGHEEDREKFAKYRIDFFHLVPFRTELSLFYKNATGAVVAAGQADCLFRDRRDGQPVIVDFKRTSKNLSVSGSGFAAKMGVGAFNKVVSSDHNRYSLQQSLYALMYEKLTGESVKACYLLQIDPTTADGSYKLIECSDYRDQAREVLESLWVPLPPEPRQAPSAETAEASDGPQASSES